MNPPLALHIATYNIHKGFSLFNRRVMVHELRERLHQLDPDILFLQEVQGLHLRHGHRHALWPAEPQHQFLAESRWATSAYGKNAAYSHGHHGNAILSRLPLLDSHNQDVTQLRFERRGLLHTRLLLPHGAGILHCVCVHLSLFGGSRRRQMLALADYLEGEMAAEAPLIIAGDFNDWRNRADTVLAQRLGLSEVFSQGDGRPVRSFPVGMPLLRLDRIYTRGFSVQRTQVLSGEPWSRISDHAALSAHLRYSTP